MSSREDMCLKKDPSAGMAADKADNDVMAKRKTVAAEVQAQLTKRRNFPTDPIPQNRISPATRDYLDSIEAGSFRLWKATQSQAESAASQTPTSAKGSETGQPSLGRKSPARRDHPEGGSPWFKPAVGILTELQSRDIKDPAASTSSGKGCTLASTWSCFHCINQQCAMPSKSLHVTNKSSFLNSLRDLDKQRSSGHSKRKDPNSGATVLNTLCLSLAFWTFPIRPTPC